MKLYKNKTNMICFISAVLLIAVIITAMPHIKGAEGTPELFINDKPWYNSSRYPLLLKDGSVYAPITAYIELMDVSVTVSDDNIIFYIVNEKNGQYISFNRALDLAYVSTKDEPIENVKSYLYGDSVYVPLSYVASAIGVSVSQYRSVAGETTYYRLTDGTQKLSFKELLKTYKPSALNPADTTTESTTVPPVTTDPPVSDTETDIDTDIEPTEPIPVYFAFNGVPKIDSALFDALAEAKVPAMFFIDSEDIKEAPDSVIKIYQSGYTVALTDSGDAENFDEYISEINAANELLSRLIKTKSHIVGKIGTSVNGSFELTKNDLIKLSSVGYVLWDYTVDGTEYSSASSINRNVKKAIKDKELAVVLLGVDKKSADALKLLLEHFSDTGLYTAEKITVYMTEINSFSYNAE